jgi:hypothetical protein
MNCAACALWDPIPLLSRSGLSIKNECIQWISKRKKMRKKREKYVDFLSIYFKIYFELLEVKILFRDLTHVFILINKNIRITELK